MNTLNKFFFRQTDNSALIVFRIAFGLLLFLETVGAIFTGWIKRTLVAPDFTFSFIGLEWLQPLPGNGMYYCYAAMGVLGLLVMIGYKYRWSLGLFTILWTATYLMQKASYNNHYYLLILICGIMMVLPANRYLSVDVKLNPSLKSIKMPQWCRWVIILQLFIVYTYAAIAKLYPDWLDFTVIKRLMMAKAHYPYIGNILQKPELHMLLTYGGILFDGLVVPALLWKPTRKIAFFASLFFHIFNSIVFQVGIFPFLSLAFILFFFSPETVWKIFLKRKKPFYHKEEVLTPGNRKWLISIFTVYFIIQILLPLRHWVIKDDVLWTEEGHRMSWRMMLRSKAGYLTFKIVDKETGKEWKVDPKAYLSPKQAGMIAVKPDVIWQFAQRLKRDYKEKGKDVSVFAIGKISVNGKPYQTLIDPKADLAAEKWNRFSHHKWILPSEKP